MLLVKILTMDLERSRQERLIRRLTQRLAMFEAHGPIPDAKELEPPEIGAIPHSDEHRSGALKKL